MGDRLGKFLRYYIDFYQIKVDIPELDYTYVYEFLELNKLPLRNVFHATSAKTYNAPTEEARRTMRLSHIMELMSEDLRNFPPDFVVKANKLHIAEFGTAIKNVTDIWKINDKAWQDVLANFDFSLLENVKTPVNEIKFRISARLA